MLEKADSRDAHRRGRRASGHQHAGMDRLYTMTESVLALPIMQEKAAQD
jgi:hypothetical protein